MVYFSKLKLEIERVCRRLPVKRLGLFGSVLTLGFGSTSDVDVPVKNPIFGAAVEKTKTVIYER
jgi:predicted nucleotidyltransferase